MPPISAVEGEHAGLVASDKQGGGQVLSHQVQPEEIDLKDLPA